MKDLLTLIIAEAQKDLDTYERILEKLYKRKKEYINLEATPFTLELISEVFDDIANWELKAQKNRLIIEMANEKLNKII